MAQTRKKRPAKQPLETAGQAAAEPKQTPAQPATPSPGVQGLPTAQQGRPAMPDMRSNPLAQMAMMAQRAQMRGAAGARPAGQGGNGDVHNAPGGGVPDPVRPGRKLPVDEERIREAQQLLLDYKSAKEMTDQRIIRCQEWWRQRNWSMIAEERGTIGSQQHKSATAWLKSSIVGKHADYMASYPAPLFMARNPEDEPEAQHLKEIVPVVLRQIGFDETYSEVGWQKIIEGTGIYAVTWDGQAQHGLGDVCIRKVNALNLYTEPGIEDIQDSTNVFLVRMEDDRKLMSQYPQLVGKLGSNTITPNEYREKEKKEKRGKSAVVDWYYKKWVGGTEQLHFCQFVGREILYASENDPACAQNGFYHHGLYPFVLDRYLPDAESIYAQGLVDEGKDTQIDIDTMSQAMVTNAICNATPRYFMSAAGGVNPDEFIDWSVPLVEANTTLGQDTLRPIEVPKLDGNTLSFYTAKVEELKTVTGNTDILNGNAPGGVKSGVGLAALQENAGRTSADSNRASYRAMGKLYKMVVELIRQFYTLERQFRIVGEDGMVSYMAYSNAGLQMRTQMDGFGGVTHVLPEFDVDVHVQREDAYTRMLINDLAQQFYQMGLFDPMAAPQALAMLQMMDFTGKDKIVQLIKQNFMMTMAQMGGHAPEAAPQSAPPQGEQEQGIAPSEAGQQPSKAHTPATDRMRERINDATKP